MSQEAFENAAKEVNALTKRPDNTELLQLYALYKQATEGDNAADRPGGFDFKAIAKHDAWEELKGQSKEVAMNCYIAFAQDLVKKYA